MENNEEMNTDLTINDMADAMQVINIAVKRGTFDMNEMEAVMKLYKKFEKTINQYNQVSNKPNQENLGDVVNG